MRPAFIPAAIVSLAISLLAPAAFAGEDTFVKLFSSDYQQQVGKSFVIDSQDAADLFLKLVPAADGKPKGTVQVWTLGPDPKQKGSAKLIGPVQMTEKDNFRLAAGLFILVSPVPDKVWLGARPDFERDFVIWSELDGQTPPDNATRIRVRRAGGSSGSKGDEKLPTVKFVRKGSESDDTTGPFDTRIGMEGGIWGLKIPGTFGSH